MKDKNNTEERKGLKKLHWLFIPGIIVLVFGVQIAFIYFYETCIPGNHTESTLSSFYSTLFTIVAVIVGVAALIGWRGIKDDFDRKINDATGKAEELKKNWEKQERELKEKTKELDEKLEQFKKIEEKVNRLHKKKDLADWAKGVVSGTERSSITSFEIKYKDDENKEVKVKEIIETLSGEYTENGWLEVVYAKEIFNNRSDGERLKKAFNIFDSIIRKNIANNNHDTSLNGVVYHMLGQLLWENYHKSKKDHYEKNGLTKDSIDQWKDGYVIDDIRRDDIAVNEKEGLNIVDCLILSMKYYEKAKKIKGQKGEMQDETLANLAIVLMELAKIKWKKKRYSQTEINDYLLDAESYLKIVKNNKPTFNTSWDLARLYHYKIVSSKKDLDQKEKLGNEREKNLTEMWDRISKKDIIFFREEIKKDWEETGFPGSESSYDNLNDKLDKMLIPK